ncbi:MAG: FAD-binding oxidoreductase, partial [Alphaproteobacteria bacterium]|nr:FAD-binding oxidoreductase [Alphaproteobacteria bacterium]
WLDPRGGAVQPLAYARGLARAAIAAGAAIHGRTRATGLRRGDGRWHVATATGAEITAGQVVLATNGYTDDLWPGLGRSVVALNSFQVATVPLSDNLRAGLLPEGHVTSDTRKLLLYFRLDHEGRLLMGGRGPLREPDGTRDWAHLERVVTKLFPRLAGTPIAHRWCGRVALTRELLPHLHAPAPGLIANIGCMGRGIGLQSAMGAAIARYLLHGDAQALPFPLRPVRPIPLRGVQRLYLSGIIAWYRMTDAGLV